MLKSFTIEGYRKFESVTFNDLGRINFFVGANNVGKTSILEAVFIWASGLSFAYAAKAIINPTQQLMREYSLTDAVSSIFNKVTCSPLQFSVSGIEDNRDELKFIHTITPYEIFSEILSELGKAQLIPMPTAKAYVNTTTFDASNTNVIQTTPIGHWTISDNAEGKVECDIAIPFMRFPPKQKVNKIAKYNSIASYIDNLDNLNIYSKLKRNGIFDDFIKEIRKIFPEVKNVEVIPYPNGEPTPITVHVSSGRDIPLYALGEGVQRWFNLLGSFLYCKDGIMCIDEVDATFHPSGQREFCRRLIDYSQRYNVQLFLSTHNLEFIDAFLKAALGKNEQPFEDFRVITMIQPSGDTQLKLGTLAGKEAWSARKKFNMELR